MCCPIHACAQVPKAITTPGADTFNGALVHSADYKGAEPYAGKRVMVVGFGESAVDIAHELAGTPTSQLRHGFPRLKKKGGGAGGHSRSFLGSVPRHARRLTQKKITKSMLIVSPMLIGC